METKEILRQLDQLKEELFPLARRATMLYALLQVRVQPGWHLWISINDFIVCEYM